MGYNTGPAFAELACVFFLGFKNFDEGERILGYAGLGLRGALSFVYSRSPKVGNPIASILKSNV